MVEIIKQVFVSKISPMSSTNLNEAQDRTIHEWKMQCQFTKNCDEVAHKPNYNLASAREEWNSGWIERKSLPSSSLLWLILPCEGASVIINEK
mgnify:CR=1 FL=1